jgi:hypothetical protein
MTPMAPASCAFWALTPKSQVPRCTSAMEPAGNPSKSLASQPLVEARLPVRLMSTATTGAFSDPEPDPVNRPVSTSTPPTDRVGSATKVKSNGSSVTCQPAARSVLAT